MLIDWIIGLVIGGAVVAIAVKKVRDKKAGKSGCGCSGCSGCTNSDHCH